MSNKRSVIWKISPEEFQKILDTSSSHVEILMKLGYDRANGNHRTLTKRIKSENFSTLLLDKNRRDNGYGKKRISDDDVFSKGSKYGTAGVKRRLIAKGIIEYRCTLCGNDGHHNGAMLSLQLDHINGDSIDNRIENLRFLCPNCHTQTSTFSNKRLRKSKLSKICIVCSGVIPGITNKKYCDLCRIEKRKIDELNIVHKRKFSVDRDTLIRLVKIKPMTEIGKMFGVSDNAIRKRCRSLGIELSKRAYIIKKIDEGSIKEIK